MKIGEGVLELGILGINKDNGIHKEISVTDLGKLARLALAFHPLAKIFTVSDMRAKAIPNVYVFEYLRALDKEIDLIRQEVNPDVIAIIKHGVQSKYEPETGIVYSEPYPKTLAHELGHSLGLKHPMDRCSYFAGCSKDYIEDHCPYSRELMGCGLHSLGVQAFSQEDIEKLRGLLK